MRRGKADTDRLRPRPGWPFQMDAETVGGKTPGGAGDPHKQGDNSQGS